MSTEPRKPLTPEQRARKNERAGELRKIRKDKKIAAELDSYREENDIIEIIEDPEITRKKIIDDKRRQSLLIARSKIKSKTEIKKEKDEIINTVTEENEILKKKLKEEADALANVEINNIKKENELLKKQMKNAMRAPRVPKAKPAKAPEADQVTQVSAVPVVTAVPVVSTIDYLAQQHYTENLKKQMRDEQIRIAMNNTFG